VRLRETIEVARPAGDVYALLAEPERRPGGAAWRDLTREDDGYHATLHAAAGAIELDFDCRFELVERREGESVRLRGSGVSPRLAFTFEGLLAVAERDGGAGATVDVDVDLRPSGTLAGLGQRRLREQARGLVADFVAAETGPSSSP
jgi:carbon monoxide dehydrogenase subunit G